MPKARRRHRERMRKKKVMLLRRRAPNVVPAVEMASFVAARLFFTADGSGQYMPCNPSVS